MDTALVSQIQYSGISHQGYIREENQDTIKILDGSQDLEAGWLFVLADGMGGYEYGKKASELAVNSLCQVFGKEGGVKKTAMLRLLQKGVDQANLAVCTEARKLGVHRMGTTLLAAGISGGTLHLIHVGDSRAYLIRGREAICLTSDHTVVGDLLRMRVIQESQVRTHAQRSILTKAIGLSLFVQPDAIQIPLQSGDRLILCSDGVWSVIEDEEFVQLSADHEQIDQCCKRIVDLALDRNTDDNASAIAIQINSAFGVSKTGETRFQWLRSLFRSLKRHDPASTCLSQEGKLVPTFFGHERVCGLVGPLWSGKV